MEPFLIALFFPPFSSLSPPSPPPPPLLLLLLLLVFKFVGGPDSVNEAVLTNACLATGVSVELLKDVLLVAGQKTEEHDGTRI